MSDDCTMTDVCHPSALDDSAETGGGDAMARGVGLMPSDAAAPTEPLPREPRSRSRWNEWYSENKDQYEFEDSERIFEFSDSYSRTGWKPFDKSAQTQLRSLLRSCTHGSLESTTEEVNCLGWTYDVKFDAFRTNRMEFANAPDDAIGYQLANHGISKNSKRWIRLTTFRVADRT